jgi:hypothetical protein
VAGFGSDSVKPSGPTTRRKGKVVPVLNSLSTAP